MKKRIIALIDFSLYSENLIKLAGSLSNAIEAEIILIHQVQVIVPALADMNSRRELIEFEKSDALRNLKQISRKIIPSEKKISFLITERPLSIVLPEIGSRDSDDLILVGLKGTGILKKIFIGSTTLKIIENLAITTIAVPVKTYNLQLERLVIATNYKFPLNRTSLDNLLRNFSGTVNEVLFISVITSDDDDIETLKNLQEIHEYYKGRITSGFRIFEGKLAFEKIKSFMKGDNRSFLVVQKGSRAINDQVFRKFLINDLVYHGSIPLVILP